jgi:rod shape-determining protein MreD
MHNGRPLGVHRRLGTWRRMDITGRYVWPVTFVLVILLFAGLPVGLPENPPIQALLRPAVALAAVFFWSIYRPAALPAPVVAGLGLLLDLLGLTPLGLWAVLLLLTQAGALVARRFLVRLGFLGVWIAFAGAAALAALLAWGAESALTVALLPIAPTIELAVTAILLYPLLAVIFINAHRGAAAPELG